MSTDRRRCARCAMEYLADAFPSPSATVCTECQRQLNEVAEHKKIAWEERKKSLIALLILTLFFVIPGVAMIAAPHALWFIFEGWRYEDLEPSEAYLVAIRLGGGALLLIPAVIWVLVISRRS